MTRWLSGPAALEMVGSTATNTSTAKVTGLIEPATPNPTVSVTSPGETSNAFTLSYDGTCVELDLTATVDPALAAGGDWHMVLPNVPVVFWHCADRRRAAHSGRRRQPFVRCHLVLRQLLQHAVGLRGPQQLRLRRVRHDFFHGGVGPNAAGPAGAGFSPMADPAGAVSATSVIGVAASPRVKTGIEYCQRASGWAHVYLKMPDGTTAGFEPDVVSIWGRLASSVSCFVGAVEPCTPDTSDTCDSVFVDLRVLIPALYTQAVKNWVTHELASVRPGLRESAAL